MTRTDRAMAERNLDLVFEFERYLAQHPALEAKIPDTAMLVFQVEGDAAFNRWSRRVAARQSRRGGAPVVYVTIRRMGPVRSPIEALRIDRAA